jgi:hypothetical protein
MNSKLWKETLRKFPGILCDLENFDKEETDENILAELEWLLYKVECDGWEEHLEKPTHVRMLRNLIKKYKGVVV